MRTGCTGRTGTALGGVSGDVLVAVGSSRPTGDGGDVVVGAGAATEGGGDEEIRGGNSGLSTGGSVAVMVRRAAVSASSASQRASCFPACEEVSSRSEPVTAARVAPCGTRTRRPGQVSLLCRKPFGEVWPELRGDSGRHTCCPSRRCSALEGWGFAAAALFHLRYPTHAASPAKGTTAAHSSAVFTRPSDLRRVIAASLQGQPRSSDGVGFKTRGLDRLRGWRVSGTGRMLTSHLTPHTRAHGPGRDQLSQL
jgi:hypothetical protein